MRRAVIFLLVACAVLAMGSTAGGLARAAQRAGGEHFPGPQLADTPTASFFVRLPLVFRNPSPAPTWVTVVEEDFEGPPAQLWTFYDYGQQGLYYWGQRDCRYYSGTHSAWAVGGGTSGLGLSCHADYPADVDSRMEYGPFSLEDATAADLRFTFWLNRGNAYDRDEFCWSAGSSSAELLNNEMCLTFDTNAWSPMTLDLGDPNAINLLGRSQVWIAFRFTSYGIGPQAEGAYVDDVVVRKCVGGTCPASSGSVSVPAAVRAERTLGTLPATRPLKPSSSGR